MRCLPGRSGRKGKMHNRPRPNPKGEGIVARDRLLAGGLIKSISPDRLGEEMGDYRARTEHEQEHEQGARA